jgi:uncharacterized RDD family membrane protein YckC
VPAPEKLTIDTPEQIPLEFPLAGVGSRFLAIAFDTLLQAIGVLVLVVVLLTVRFIARAAWPSIGPWVAGALLLVGFAIYAAYFAVFESIWSGQTPGKRLVGLRVIDVSGRPLTVYAALIRNLLRIVDQVPGIYAVAIITVVITRRNQRLGDLAAGTVVVHERADAIAEPVRRDRPAARYGAHRLAPSEVVLIEEFLRRRSDLDSWVRRQSAQRIAARMKAKLEVGVVADDVDDDDERLLEELAAEYRASDGYR